MRKLVVLALTGLCLLAGRTEAQMVTGGGMKNFNQVFDLPKKESGDFKAVLLDLNKVAGIYYPGETTELSFQLQNLTDQKLTGEAKLEVIGYGTRGIPGDIWLPEVFLIDKLPPIKLEVALEAKGWKNYQEKITLPERFGGYAVVLDMGKNGRQLLATLVRAVEPKVPLVQFPSQALDGVNAALLERVGVHAVRWGNSFCVPGSPEYAKHMADLDRDLKYYKDHNVTVVVEVGGGNYPRPLGEPRPHLDDKGVWTDIYQKDWVWAPSEDANFKKYVKEIVSKYGWPKGPVTGFKIWNEPWEGTSISGWQADLPRFREIHKAMAETVLETNKEAGVNVLVGGADSSTNTWDKFFPDGSDEFMPYFDFCSIHYQGLQAPVLYKQWHDRKVGNGRVLVWDTESWVANTDDRFGALVASNRAAGYDRSMGIFIGNVFTTDNFGNNQYDKVFTENSTMNNHQVPSQAWSPAASICASQALIGERKFKEILFQNGLPWVYCFNGMDNNPDDGTIVIVGEVGSLFAQPDNMLFRTVRSLAELDQPAADGSPQPYRGATITIPADGDYSLYDFYANPVAAKDGQYVIPLDARGFYLRGDPNKPGSFAKLTEAVKKGRIEGIAAVEIKALDFIQPVSEQTTLRLKVTNVLNRPVAGTLAITLGNVKTQSGVEKFAANETRMLAFPISGLKPAADNRYPLEVKFQGENGAGERGLIRDTLHVNYIARRTIKVDGDLSDWQNVLPQVIEGTGAAKQTVTEAAWLPMVPYQGGDSGGFATGYVAYDDDYFYFAAKIADSSIDPGTLRFATRDDDEFFYPEISYKKEADGKLKEMKWPEGVRRFSYRKDPILPAGCFPSFDNVQIAFNAIPQDQKADLLTNLPGRPVGFVPVRDTDYEYALNTVAPKYGGGFEVWRLRVPGMVSKNFYPRQPKDPHEGAVTNAKLITRYVDNMRITEVAIPWSEMPEVKKLLDANKPVKFAFKVNNNTGGPDLESDKGRSVSRQTNLGFHVDWRESWANELEFGWEPKN